MNVNNWSRFCSIKSLVLASRFNRNNGSVFDGRTLQCQSGNSIETPSNHSTLPPSPNLFAISWSLASGFPEMCVLIFAGDEVFRFQGLEQVGQSGLPSGQHFQNHQGRNDSRVCEKKSL